MNLNRQNVLMVDLDIAVKNKMKKFIILLVFINQFINTLQAYTVNVDSCYIKNQLDYDYLIVEGYRFLLNGNMQMAESIYEKAVKYEKCGAAAYFQLSKIKLIKGDAKSAEYYAEKACLISDNNTYLLNYINILKITGNRKIINSIIKRRLNEGVLDNELIYEYINSFIEENELRLAKKEMRKYHKILTDDLINRLNIAFEMKRENYENVLLILNSSTYIDGEEKNKLKAKIFTELQKNDSLKALIKNGSDLNSNFKREIAEIIIKNEKDAKTDIIKDLIENNIKDIEFEKWLIQFIINETSKDNLKEINLEEFIYKLKNYCYKDSETQFYATLADYYDKIELKDSLIAQLEILRRLDATNVFVYFRLIETYYSSNKWLKVVDICKDAKNIGLDDIRFNYFMGLAFYQMSDYENAKKNLESCLLSYVNDDFKYMVKGLLAEVYYKLGLFEFSDSLFEEVIKYNPNDLTARNNYAYYLAIREKRLDKAEDLSKYTIEREKNNASFFDTYAWILYKQGKYREAVKYIEKAIEIDKGNYIIWDHYGYILYKIRKRKMAENAWKRSCELKNCIFSLEEKLENERKINE